AASGSVTVAFFALFGFIFVVTQYFQFVLGYSPLEAGARLAPFAIATAVASVLGARAAGELGTKTVVAGGLASMAVGFAWTAAVVARAGDSLGAALAAAKALPHGAAGQLAHQAQSAFLDGLAVGCYLAAATALLGAGAALVFVPGARRG